jgi:hypothetical protein
LRVLVVNDPELVEGLNRLRGEWSERSGSKLTASGTIWDALDKSKVLDADVLIFPSRYLGELCTRKWLRPVRPAVLESDDVKSADIFPLVRNEVIKWGGQTMALPLGLDPQAITDKPSKSGALALLRAAAPRAVTNDRVGVLFDVETMKPRITEQPFVDALNGLAQPNGTPADQANGTRQSEQLPILGHNDLLIGVTTSSHNAATAFKLITWLALPETSGQFAHLDGGMLPVRISNASSPAWYGADISADDRSRFAKHLSNQLNGQRFLVVPRIPGIDEYLAALDDAAKAVTVDKLPADETLHKAAQRWEQITEARGRDAQRDAYQKHLGITK